MKTVLTTGQVAKICKVAPRTVSKWFDDGALRGYRIPTSKDRRIPRDSLIEFLKANNMPLGNLEGLGKHKVLFIGTETLLTNRIKETLSGPTEYLFEHTDTSFGAGIMVGSFYPDSIIIDLGIGRAEALQIAASLRKEKAFSSILIIGIASEDEVHPDQLVWYGFSDIFKKPFDTAALCERIRTTATTKHDN